MNKLGLLVALAIAVSSIHHVLAQDPLASWHDTAARRAITAFVARVTTAGSPAYVIPSQRIAVFDNDGTLCCESPLPLQAAFALDEARRLSTIDPSLGSDPMVSAAVKGDIGRLLEGPRHDGLLRVIALTHTGMTTEEFRSRVRQWLATAKDPRFGKRYTDLTYQPMLELLKYLRANEFKTFIVSGGGADFIRVWSEDVYGIVPENVVGTSSQTKYEMREGQPILVKTMDHLFIDDKEGKPVGIHQFIGRRPIACFGNSDGDQAMLEFTTIGNPLPSFGLILHHTDAEREYAYDAKPKSSGKLVTALKAADDHGWTVVDMQKDWKTVWRYP